jgi:uncharacterized protein YaiE (UPF0345 family)
MDKHDLIVQLSKRWPNAEALRKEFSGLRALLQGEFATDKFNVYERPYSENGIVVSWPLNQGLVKNPTVGIIAPGKYSFETGENIETMTILEGMLYAKSDGTRWSELEKYGSIMAPAGAILSLEVELRDFPVFYLCQYKPKK